MPKKDDKKVTKKGNETGEIKEVSRKKIDDHHEEVTYSDGSTQVHF
ncbi:MAG: hypothetical protein ABIJ97_08500 [Bacteroidota bacterium]